MAAAFAVVSFALPSARAQLQQPFVFSSGGAVASRNDQSGSLSAVAGSPFLTPSQAPSSAFTIDVQGRFLFALGTNSIRMFQITDSTTGAYQEVANSPFASATTSQPMFIAVEPTGQFLAVVDRVGQEPGDASVETFQIAPNAAGGPALIPVTGSALELDSVPVGVAQPPDNKEFLIFMGPNPQSSNQTIQFGSEFQDLSIDPQTGFLTGYQMDAANSERGDSFAMDPQGRYYVTGTQDNLLEFGIVQLIGMDGNELAGNLQLPLENYPVGLWIDSTGTFLYVATSFVDAPTIVSIYSVNVQTGELTETSSSPLPGFTSIPPYYADPTGSFDFGFGTDQNTAIAYTVDPLTGYFIETANSPFTIPQIAGALTFSIPPGQQGVSGPSASLSASSFSFGTIQTGSASMPQVVTITSNGGQALSLDSISLGGSDPGQFVESDTCQAPSVLQPTKFCSISITFQPTDTGLQQATLSITDNAPDSPQSVQVNGTGAAPPPPAPAVTISPNPVTFSTIAQGATSSPIVAAVTNSGNATLHISSVLLGGNNPDDFSMTNGCSGAYAANASCAVSLTFSPLAAGQRTAVITITDDAQNSPQYLEVSGTATAAPSTKSAVSLSSTSVSFPAATQGTSSSPQTVTVTSSGGATLHISSVVLGGTNGGDFLLANGCTAAAYAVNATCTIGITFAPVGIGARAATITITDDAPDSPQVISLGGFSNAAFTLGAAPSSSTSATITAGQTAQYNLQINPASGFTGVISLACVGAPSGATCTVPANVQISNGSPVPFTVVVTTSGATALPPRFWPPSRPFPGLPLAWASFAGLSMFLLLALLTRRDGTSRWRRLALSGAFASAALLVTFSSAGCGGGSANLSVSQTSPLVTPQGTSIITVTASATSASGQPLQLPSIQLSLTVN